LTVNTTTYQKQARAFPHDRPYVGIYWRLLNAGCGLPGVGCWLQAEGSTKPKKNNNKTGEIKREKRK